MRGSMLFTRGINIANSLHRTSQNASGILSWEFGSFSQGQRQSLQKLETIQVLYTITYRVQNLDGNQTRSSSNQ